MSTKTQIINGYDFSALPMDIKYVGMSKSHDGWDRNNYEVTIEEEKFPFFTGMGWKKAPVAADVMHALLLDAQAGEMGYQEFLDEFGYEVCEECFGEGDACDNPKCSAAIHRACQGVAEQLDRLFSQEQMEQLREALHDY